MDLLLVEDDDAIAEPLVKGLERQGFAVRRESTGEGALAALAAAPRTEIVLLDLGLPDIDGYEVCRRIRTDSSVPIIVITARGDEIDRVLGLELGADDYLVKPFGFRELVARIRAVTRRSGGPRRRRRGPGRRRRRRRASTPGPTGSPSTATRSPSPARSSTCSPSWPATPAPPAPARRSSSRSGTPTGTGPPRPSTSTWPSLRRKLGDPTLVETVRGVGFRLRAPATSPSAGPPT